MNVEKQRLKQEFLISYRAAQKKIDPELLDIARSSIVEAVLSAKSKKTDEEPSKIPIDRKKNMETVIKFLEIKSKDSSNAGKDISALLTELLS